MNYQRRFYIVWWWTCILTKKTTWSFPHGASPLIRLSSSSTYHSLLLLATSSNLDDNQNNLINNNNNNNNEESFAILQQQDHSVVWSIQNRYACTRFERFDHIRNSTTMPSTSDPTIVNTAKYLLDVARRAPSGFNAQPYKLLFIHTPPVKQKLAQYCIGHNAHRVRDSDCTVLFLADRQTCWTLRRYKTMIQQHNPTLWDNPNNPRRWKLVKIQLLITMFSQGLPGPQIISGPISFVFRCLMGFFGYITRHWYPLPTLHSAETWSQKNTMLVAMSYLLACTSRGIATCPMEGYNTAGIRRLLKIPRRYTIPLIVATGRPYIRDVTTTTMSNIMGMTTTTPTPTITTSQEMSTDDAGISHGPPTGWSSITDMSSSSSTTTSTNTTTSAPTGIGTPRYPKQDVLFEDEYGRPLTMAD